MSASAQDPLGVVVGVVGEVPLVGEAVPLLSVRRGWLVVPCELVVV
jgi:hypothetical protein